MIKFLLLMFAVSPLTLLAAASPALAAAPPSGRDFGCHVSMHAQAAALGRGMNPGQHQGFSNWAGSMPC